MLFVEGDNKKFSALTIISRIIPVSLKKIIYRIGSYLVRDLDDISIRHPSMYWSLRNLKRLGYNPRSVIDVGAYHGNWTKMMKTVFPDCNILMIEAQPGKEEIIRRVRDQYDGSVKYDINILGSSDKQEVTFFEMESGSSVFEEISSYPRTKTKRQTTTLDLVAKRHNFDKPDFLKLDVQGFELEVLRGAITLIPSIEIMLLEVSLAHFNEGAPLFNEVIEFMKERRFVPYDICSLMRRPSDKALCHVDIIFVKQNSFLFKQTGA